MYDNEVRMLLESMGCTEIHHPAFLSKKDGKDYISWFDDDANPKELIINEMLPKGQYKEKERLNLLELEELFNA